MKKIVILILIFAFGNTLWAQDEKKELKHSVSVSYNVLSNYLNNPIFMIKYGKQIYKNKSFRLKFESGIGRSVESFGEIAGILPSVILQLSMIGSIQKRKHNFLFGLNSMTNPFYKSSLINVSSGYKYDFTNRLYFTGDINMSILEYSPWPAWPIRIYGCNSFVKSFLSYPILSVGFGINF